jgi:hypothetical protein
VDPGSIDKDRDGEEEIANRPLAILKDGPRRYRKLIAATAAFPEFAGRGGVNLEASAFWAIRLAFITGPLYRYELGMRLLVPHSASTRPERERRRTDWAFVGCSKQR